MGKRLPINDRITKYSSPQLNGCILWTGAILKGNRGGYGLISVAGKLHRAHRFIYQLKYGPVPEGLVLDHLCRNRSCVNPDHLEPVTSKENVNRGNHWNREKTHCRNGHEFTEENTYNWNGDRKCRECGKLNARRYRANGVKTHVRDNRRRNQSH